VYQFLKGISAGTALKYFWAGGWECICTQIYASLRFPRQSPAHIPPLASTTEKPEGKANLPRLWLHSSEIWESAQHILARNLADPQNWTRSDPGDWANLWRPKCCGCSRSALHQLRAFPAAKSALPLNNFLDGHQEPGAGRRRSVSPDPNLITPWPCVTPLFGLTSPPRAQSWGSVQAVFQLEWQHCCF